METIVTYAVWTFRFLHVSCESYKSCVRAGSDDALFLLAERLMTVYESVYRLCGHVYLRCYFAEHTFYQTLSWTIFFFHRFLPFIVLRDSFTVVH